MRNAHSDAVAAAATTRQQPVERLLSVTEVAVVLGISELMVRHYIRDGELPVVRVSERCLRVRPDDLRDFIDRRVDRQGKDSD